MKWGEIPERCYDNDECWVTRAVAEMTERGRFRTLRANKLMQQYDLAVGNLAMDLSSGRIRPSSYLITPFGNSSFHIFAKQPQSKVRNAEFVAAFSLLGLPTIYHIPVDVAGYWKRMAALLPPSTVCAFPESGLKDVSVAPAVPPLLATEGVEMKVGDVRLLKVVAYISRFGKITGILRRVERKHGAERGKVSPHSLAARLALSLAQYTQTFTEGDMAEGFARTAKEEVLEEVLGEGTSAGREEAKEPASGPDTEHERSAQAIVLQMKTLAAVLRVETRTIPRILARWLYEVAAQRQNPYNANALCRLTRRMTEGD